MTLEVPMTVAVIGLIGAYVITSIVLLKRPGILYKKRKRFFHAAHISHRGGAGERLENTLSAFERAVSLSTDMLELDCHLLSNGDVVVSHDSNLSRLTGIASDISSFDIHSLPPILDKLQLTFSPGHFVTASTPQERRFILLSEVFQAFPDTPMNIDIKINDDELIRKVNEMICLYNREKITIWGNKCHDINNKCFKLNQNIGTLFSQRRIFEIMILFYTGLLPFFPIRETHFEIPMLKILLEPEFESYLHLSQFKRFLIWLFDKLLMRPSLIKHLKDRGIPTYVWVCNTETQFTDAFEAGAEGVMTDFPSLLRQFLEKHPKYQPAGFETNRLTASSGGDVPNLKKR